MVGICVELEIGDSVRLMFWTFKWAKVHIANPWIYINAFLNVASAEAMAMSKISI